MERSREENQMRLSCVVKKVCTLFDIGRPQSSHTSMGFDMFIDTRNKSLWVLDNKFADLRHREHPFTKTAFGFERSLFWELDRIFELACFHFCTFVFTVSACKYLLYYKSCCL